MDTQLANFSTNTLVAKYQTQDTMTESCDFDANQCWINLRISDSEVSVLHMHFHCFHVKYSK